MKRVRRRVRAWTLIAELSVAVLVVCGVSAIADPHRIGEDQPSLARDVLDQSARLFDVKDWPLLPVASAAITQPPTGNRTAFEKSAPSEWAAFLLPVDIGLCRLKHAPSCVRVMDTYEWAAHKQGWYNLHDRADYWGAFRRAQVEACEAGDGPTCLMLSLQTNEMRHFLMACDHGEGEGCYRSAIRRVLGKAEYCRCEDPDQQPDCRGFPAFTVDDDRAATSLLRQGCALGYQYSCDTTTREIRRQYFGDHDTSRSYERYQKKCATARSEEFARMRRDL
jgi:hypothetical protein